MDEINLNEVEIETKSRKEEDKLIDGMKQLFCPSKTISQSMVGMICHCHFQILYKNQYEQRRIKHLYMVDNYEMNVKLSSFGMVIVVDFEFKKKGGKIIEEEEEGCKCVWLFS